MNARHNILAKLKAKVDGADTDKLPIEPPYCVDSKTKEQQFEQFVALLELNKAIVIEADEAQLPQVVAKQMSILGINTLLHPTQQQLTSSLQSIDDQVELHPFDFTLSQEKKDWLFGSVDAAITSSHGAIAALGAIALWPDDNEPRTMSLVPPVHFVVVKRDEIYPDFPSLMDARQWTQNIPTNALLISGPSKTGDIQQYMAFGAHGPKHLVVLIV